MKKLLLYAAAITILLSLAGCADSSMFTSGTTAPDITDPVIPTTTPDSVIPTTTPDQVILPAEPETVIFPAAPDTDSNKYEYKPADIPQQYWAVLNNAQKIHFPYGEYQKDIFLDDYAFPRRSPVAEKLKYLEGIEYSVITTINSQVMLAIKGTWGTLILYEEDGVVYGRSKTVRNMYLLYDDGSYCWTETNEYGSAQLCFKNGKFASIELERFDRELDKYYIGGVEVTYDELLAHGDDKEKVEALWSPLTRYPLEVAPPLGG